MRASRASETASLNETGAICARHDGTAVCKAIPFRLDFSVTKAMVPQDVRGTNDCVVGYALRRWPGYSAEPGRFMKEPSAGA